MTLWTKEEEIDFFKSSMKFSTLDDLFYIDSVTGERYAYWPNDYKGEKNTLQSRNTLIGHFTERWCQELFHSIVKPLGYYSVSNVVCPEIGLSRQSDGDLAICTTNSKTPSPEEILILFEIKMSIVWNWGLKKNNDIATIKCIGDYLSHKGSPSLQRSDSMLKAIGKGINIKVSSPQAYKIPYVVLGNTPIRGTYLKKVDLLKVGGVVQGFWSLNPNPLPNNPKSKKYNLGKTENNGFLRVDEPNNLRNLIMELIDSDAEFFSSMIPKGNLGKLIEMANLEKTYVAKAEKFLQSLRGGF